MKKRMKKPGVGRKKEGKEDSKKDLSMLMKNITQVGNLEQKEEIKIISQQRMKSKVLRKENMKIIVILQILMEKM